ncbi:MAG: hypothetical protein F4X64_01250 [Chloroflexi bacterium]|nr:hypothetical protein [Chloroflexota bacterium]
MAGFDQRVDQANVPTYAAELFGQENDLTFPSDKVPVVTLMLKAEEAVAVASSTAEVTFSFANAKFVDNVAPGALACQSTANDGGGTTDLPDTGIAWAAAPGCTVTRSADDGGAGDSTVTFMVTTGTDPDTGPTDGTDPTNTQMEAGFRLVLTVPAVRATGAVTVSTNILTTAGPLPGKVAPCEIVDNPDTRAADESDPCNQITKTASAVTAAAGGGSDKAVIDLDDFTKIAAGADGKTPKVYIGSYTFTVDNKGGTILGPDGTPINEDAAATLSISVDGDLNAGDMIKVSGVDSKTLTVGESGGVSTLVTLTSAAAGLTGLTAPAPTVVKYTLTVGLEYVPGGKSMMSHGAEIESTFDAKFTRVQNKALHAKPPEVVSTLLLKGVQKGDLRAYAIPASSNGKMDVANVRIRCEDGDRDNGNMCRVFVECWDDMGMGGVGEHGEGIYENAVVRLTAEDLEMASGLMPMAGMRHSCRILATGEATVQTLVRDGTTGTLVNNTVVGTAN